MFRITLSVECENYLKKREEWSESQLAKYRRENKPQIPREAVVDLLG
jgi:hypothetical protein